MGEQRGGGGVTNIERRAHRRLECSLPVECRKGPHVVRTITRNISTGGLCFELEMPDFAVGDRIDINLTLPAAEGVSPYPGRGSSPAEVVRVTRSTQGDGTPRFGFGIRFLQPLELAYRTE